MKRSASPRRISEKRQAQLGGKVPFSSIASKPTPIKKRGAKKARREAKYKAYLSSAAWKTLRLAVFERDGFQCTNEIRASERAWLRDYALSQSARRDERTGMLVFRCPNEDATRKGKGLVADHLTYARFGHENLEDLRTLCQACNQRLTTQERANWATPRKGRQ